MTQVTRDVLAAKETAQGMVAAFRHCVAYRGVTENPAQRANRWADSDTPGERTYWRQVKRFIEDDISGESGQ